MLFEVISRTAAENVNIQCFQEIDERQDDKTLLEWVGLHQIDPISMEKWNWKKNMCKIDEAQAQQLIFFISPM